MNLGSTIGRNGGGNVAYDGNYVVAPNSTRALLCCIVRRRVGRFEPPVRTWLLRKRCLDRRFEPPVLPRTGSDCCRFARFWLAGSPGRRFAGSRVRRFIGSPVHRSTGSPAYRLNAYLDNLGLLFSTSTQALFVGVGDPSDQLRADYLSMKCLKMVACEVRHISPDLGESTSTSISGIKCCMW
jgi:hypothetical protein